MPDQLRTRPGTRLCALTLLATLPLAGCSAEQSSGADPDTTTATVTPHDVTVFPPGTSWEEAVQPLIVRISNQSFDDPDVLLSATLDGKELFSQSFAVEGQHTVTLFAVDPGPGRHILTVVSDSGAELTQALEIPAGEQRWIAVDYWYLDPETKGVTWGGDEVPGPSFDVHVSDEPILIS